MSLNKKDIIIKLHRSPKTPVEIQAVINILFYDEIGFATFILTSFRQSLSS